MFPQQPLTCIFVDIARQWKCWGILGSHGMREQETASQREAWSIGWLLTTPIEHIKIRLSVTFWRDVDGYKL
jgi:hypothetical protein